MAERGRKQYGKGKIAHNEQLCLFPQCFEKAYAADK